MRTQIALVALAAALAGCGPNSETNPLNGVSPVNVPVVSRADYAIDVAAPDGSLAAGEDARLDAWFRSLQLGYGDAIYVDGANSDGARGDVARIAGRYGLMVSFGAPITQGAVPGGSVRVVVSRTQATVPNCPNWSVPSQPNFGNASMANMGCGVNTNLAAMIANPQDLIHGQEGSGLSDASTANRAIGIYRTTPPTGTKGLQDISTKKGN